MPIDCSLTFTWTSKYTTNRAQILITYPEVRGTDIWEGIET